MINLLFKILADASGFKRTLNNDLPAAAKAGAKKAGTEGGNVFAKEFGGQVKGAIMSVIGISAITAAIKKAVTDAQEIAKEASGAGISVEAAQELQRASKLTGLSIDELKKSATTAPQEFSALMRYVQRTGGPQLNQADVEQLTSTSDLFGGISAAISKGFAKVTAFGGGAITDLASKGALAIGTLGNLQSERTGFGGGVSDRFNRAGVMLEAMRDRQYERGFGIAQGEQSPTGSLIRKLDEIKQTMEKKL